MANQQKTHRMGCVWGEKAVSILYLVRKQASGQVDHGCFGFSFSCDWCFGVGGGVIFFRACCLLRSQIRKKRTSSIALGVCAHLICMVDSTLECSFIIIPPWRFAVLCIGMAWIGHHLHLLISGPYRHHGEIRDEEKKRPDPMCMWSWRYIGPKALMFFVDQSKPFWPFHQTLPFPTKLGRLVADVFMYFFFGFLT